MLRLGGATSTPKFRGRIYDPIPHPLLSVSCSAAPLLNFLAQRGGVDGTFLGKVSNFPRPSAPKTSFPGRYRGYAALPRLMSFK